MKNLNEIIATITTISSVYGEFRDGKPEVNMSAIWTTLIKEAGKCKAYASDLLIDYDSIKEDMSAMMTAENFNREYWFGFRDMGVDHESFIRCKAESSCYDIHKEYFAVYRLRFEENYENSYDFRVVLEKIGF